MAYNPQDFYFKKAKKENYLARSVYKLEAIDKKFKLFRSGMFVLDLGASPGSWSQYASKKVGEKGLVFAIDLTELKLSEPNIVCATGDATVYDYATEFQKLGRHSQVDLLISDMAPKTTGIRFTDQARSAQLVEFVVQLSDTTLKPGGHMVAKLFHSDDFRELKTEMLKRFEKFEAVKPESTRKESKEIFLIGLNKK